MNDQIRILAAVLPAVILLVLLVLFFHRCWNFKRKNLPMTDQTRTESLRSGLAKVHLRHNESNRNYRAGLHDDHYRPRDFSDKTRSNYHVLRRGVLAKPLFNWADHPRLVLEAVERGWPRFAFGGFSSSLPRSTGLWDLCTAGENGKEDELEISWEVLNGSSDYMQKIKFNLPQKKSSHLDVCYVRMALPIPGPFLGNSSFPQEAYFEITICFREEHIDDDVDGPRISTSQEFEGRNLIQDTHSGAKSDALIHVNSSTNQNTIDKPEERKDPLPLISLGLTGGSSVPSRFPGTYPGSIGFNSNGSLHLDGMTLVTETKEADWGHKTKVIGCGFDPRRRRVLFTVDSEPVHLIHCKTEEFSSPLYPMLATNTDVTVVVNMGQSPFMYNAANTQRTPNPCFLRPSLNNAAASALGYEEDSRELFSMGRINSRWLTLKNNSTGSGICDDVSESETDLFEIVLDDLSSSR